MSDLIKKTDVDFVYGSCKRDDSLVLAENVMCYLYADISNLKDHYIRLGKHLAEFKSCEYYRAFGFPDFNSCISANLGMESSEVSRCISVYRRFGMDDKKIQYEDYSYSQLVELLNVDNDDLSQFDSSMSVRAIRDKKKLIRLNSIESANISYDEKNCDVANKKSYQSMLDSGDFYNYCSDSYVANYDDIVFISKNDVIFHLGKGRICFNDSGACIFVLCQN